MWLQTAPCPPPESHRFLKSGAFAALGILIVAALIIAWKSIPDSLSKMSSVHGGLSGIDFCTSASVCIANVYTLGLKHVIERALGKEQVAHVLRLGRSLGLHHGLSLWQVTALTERKRTLKAYSL